MNKIYFLIISFVFLTANISVSAQQPENKNEEASKKNEQETINRQMTLEREYDPTIMDATKINTLPKVREMVITKSPIVYSNYASPLQLESEINILPSGIFMTDVERYANKGYLHFAGGMLTNLAGDFGYQLLNTDRDELRFHFSHRSTNGNVKFSDETTEKRKAKLNDNVGGLDFKHVFEPLTLSIGGKIGYSAFNYYGLPTNNLLSISSIAQVYNSDFDTNQGDRTINLYAGIASNIDTKLGYHLGVDYTNFNQKYSLSADYKGITENNIGLSFGMNSPVKDEQCFGIDVKMNILSYTEPEPVSGLKTDSANFDNRYELTFNPYYKIDRESLRFLLGINLMVVSQQDETDFFVSPNIKLDVPFSTSSLFYVDLGGGIESNTMSELSQINRYINPSFTPDASKSWIDAKLGVRSSITSGFWIDIFGGFKYTESDIFFNPPYYPAIDNGFNNVSMAFQPTSQRLQFGASLKYDYKSVFGFYLKGVYNYYTFKYIDSWKNSMTFIPENDDFELYGKPAMTANLGIYAKPLSQLTLNLDYNLLSGMYAFVNQENVKMNAINDVRLRGSWQFNDTFSLYGQFNNLLFRQQEIFYGYPLQPFTAMAGININF